MSDWDSVNWWKRSRTSSAASSPVEWRTPLLLLLTSLRRTTDAVRLRLLSLLTGVAIAPAADDSRRRRMARGAPGTGAAPAAVQPACHRAANVQGRVGGSVVTRGVDGDNNNRRTHLRGGDT